MRGLHNSLQPHAEGVYVNNLEDEGEARVREAVRSELRASVTSEGPV